MPLSESVTPVILMVKPPTVIASCDAGMGVCVGVGVGLGTAVGVAPPVGVASAMAEAADVAWGQPAEDRNIAPAMMTMTRPTMPSPTNRGEELRRAGVGAYP